MRMGKQRNYDKWITIGFWVVSTVLLVILVFFQVKQRS